MRAISRDAYLAENVPMFVASIFIAIVLARSGTFERFIGATEGVRIVGSFVAGFFFTSLFTTAPAIVAIVTLARTEPLPVVVLVGALGAMVGDFILFSILKREVVETLAHLFKHQKHRRIIESFRTKLVRSLLMLAGMLVIASPLPDEIGLALLGINRLTLRLLAPVSFVFNAFGIFLIAVVSRATG